MILALEYKWAVIDPCDCCSPLKTGATKRPENYLESLQAHHLVARRKFESYEFPCRLPKQQTSVKSSGRTNDLRLWKAWAFCIPWCCRRRHSKKHMMQNSKMPNEQYSNSGTLELSRAAFFLDFDGWKKDRFAQSMPLIHFARLSPLILTMWCSWGAMALIFADLWIRPLR